MYAGKANEDAFRRFYEEYYAPFCLYAGRFVADMDTRKDLVSEVFASLWHKVESGEISLREDTIAAYVKMCVRNRCINHLKHMEYESGYADRVKICAPSYEEGFDNIYTLEELYKMLYETLCRLPESCRETFTKSFFEGKTQAEIAEEMNVSVKSVGRWKQKTIELLKVALKDFLPVILFLISQR